MNRYEIGNLLIKKYGIQGIDINAIEETLIVLTPEDYVNPEKKIEFPLSVLGIYGIGSNSEVLEVQDSSGEIYALRLTSNLSPELLYIQNVLSQYDLAPILYYAGRTRISGVSFTISDSISGTLDSYIKDNRDLDLDKISKALKCLLDKKYLLNFIHGDLHLENIAILKDGTTLGFIDFDWSFLITEAEFTFLNILDFIPLLGTLNREGERSIALRVKNYFEGTFRINIDMDQIKTNRYGGFVYKGLFSYIKNFRDKGALGQIASAFVQNFPDFTLPKIVE